MPTVTLHPRVEQMLHQRCFLLFMALLALLVATPFLWEISHGRAVIGLIMIIVLVTAVWAVARSRRSFVIALLLGLPALAFQILALQSGSPEYFALAWGVAAAFFTFTLAIS